MAALFAARAAARACALRVCHLPVAVKVEVAVEDCVAQFGGLDVADANAGHLGP